MVVNTTPQILRAGVTNNTIPPILGGRVVVVTNTDMLTWTPDTTNRPSRREGEGQEEELQWEGQKEELRGEGQKEGLWGMGEERKSLKACVRLSAVHSRAILNCTTSVQTATRSSTTNQTLIQQTFP